MPNEIRKDYLLDRWVIIASERAKRPTDFPVRATEETDTAACPFCPGNEKMTPPAVLLYLPSNGNTIKEKDSDGKRAENWLVRCIPNLYPALNPRKPLTLAEDALHMRKDGVGAQEVIIESPNHDEHPDKAPLSQIRLVVQAYLDRLKALSNWEYVSIFRNHKKEAGASLSHAHSQMIATPMIPKAITDELGACTSWFEKTGDCPYCEIIASERNSPRLVLENHDFVALAPWASVHPFELWLIPKEHQHTLLQMEENQKDSLAQALKTCLGGFAETLSDPAYCYGFHIAPTHEGHEYFHWHLEVYPKLTIQAGFEKSTGLYINVTPPEMAAQSLRQSIANM